MGTEEFALIQALSKKVNLLDSRVRCLACASGEMVTLYTGDGSITDTTRIVNIDTSSELRFIYVTGTGDNYVRLKLGDGHEADLTHFNGTDGSESSFQLNRDLIFIRSQDVTNNKGGEFHIDAFDEQNGATYIDHDIIPTGIKYDDDYSATYVDRSLVDKAYVQSKFARTGQVNLVNGTATVSSADVVSSTIIMLTLNTPGGVLGVAYSAPSASIIDNTSFVINAVDASGAVLNNYTSTINWLLIN